MSVALSRAGSAGSRLHDAYLATLVEGNPRQARLVVEDLLSQGIAVSRILVEVLAPGMRSIGDLWQAGLVTVAQEHLASAITEAQLAWLAPLLPGHPMSAAQIVLSGTPGELHVVGLRMLADMLAAEGWQVFNLGASLPADDLIDLVAHRQPDVVGLSTSLTTHLRDVRDIAARLHVLPMAPVVILGGAAYGGDADLARRVGADIFASDAIIAADRLRPILAPGRRRGGPDADAADVSDDRASVTELHGEPAALEAAGVGVARLDAHGRIVSANDAFEDLAGRAVAGLPLEALVAAAQRDLVRSLIAGAGATWVEVFLGFVRDEAAVPVDRVARVGRVGTEVVIVVEETTAAVGRVNEGLLALVHDLVEAQRLLETKTGELQTALEDVRSARLMLRKVQGILPICMGCGRVRTDDDRHWVEIGEYIARSGSIALSHGYCPRCADAELD
jgi:methanogenic corrinoid protein MtbC1